MKKPQEFAASDSGAAASLRAWRTIVRSAQWTSFADARAAFASADQVADKTIFNIARNRYRLIAYINYFGAKLLARPAVARSTGYSRDVWRNASGVSPGAFI